MTKSNNFMIKISNVLLKVIYRGVCCAAIFSATMAEASNPLGVTVGAIRWDAWMGTAGNGSVFPKVGPYVEKNLIYHTSSTNYPYYDRWPFFAKMTSADTLEVRQLSQDIMDQDIAYAKRSGINYWAFNYYPSGSGMDIARNLYFSSTKKAGLNFAYILDTNFMPKEQFPNLVKTEFRDINYQKVLGGRPLLYIFCSNATDSKKDTVDTLRNVAAANAVPNPYIVLMVGGDANQASQLVEASGADAISTYASSGRSKWKLDNNGQQEKDANGNPIIDITPYSSLAAADLARRNSFMAMNKKVVPWVTTGWDNRPRSQSPVPWCEVTSTDTCIASPLEFVGKAPPLAIPANLQSAIDWIGANQNVADANTIIMYAWNEFDEGGWLTPTIYEGTNRVDEVSDVLRYSASSALDSNQTAGKAFDGNTTTNWQAQLGTSFAGQWLEVDFGKDSAFSQATLVEFGNRTQSYRIEYLNGSTWKTAYTGGAIGANTTVYFPQVIGRKARLFFTAGSYTPIIYEFQLNNTPITQGNLALNKSYSSSSQWDDSQSAAKAFDGTWSNWQASSSTTFSGQWLEVDFGARTSFNTVTLSEYGNRTTSYRIEYWNGNNWDIAATGTGIGNNAILKIGRTISSTKARIYFTSGNFTPIIYEFGIFLNENDQVGAATY